MNIEKYIQIPFKDKGRDLDGCDCYGLIRLFLNNEMGKDFPLLDLYSTAHADNSRLFDETLPLLSADQVETPEVGDVGVFIFGGVPAHVGVYVGTRRVLHIMRGCNSVCERFDGIRLKGRLDGWYRPK